MAYKKRVKQSTQRRKAVRFALEIDKDKWVIGAKEISELREELKGDVCPVCKQPYGTGMNQAVLDHSHESGRCRSTICASCNLFEGRLTKYFNKLLKKKDVPVEEVLSGDQSGRLSAQGLSASIRSPHSGTRASGHRIYARKLKVIVT